jgi:hypothetical protein
VPAEDVLSDRFRAGVGHEREIVLARLGEFKDRCVHAMDGERPTFRAVAIRDGVGDLSDLRPILTRVRGQSSHHPEVLLAD